MTTAALSDDATAEKQPLKKTVIGIVGGCGWMGRALGIALLEQGIVPPQQLVVSSRSGARDGYRDWPGVRCVQNNQALANLADITVLSIRPEDLANVMIETHNKLVISFLAMAPLQEVASQVGSHRVVRAMPNAAAQIKRSYFPWYAAESVTTTDKQLVQTVLASCGMPRELPREQDIDYLTALSGAGPAYPALLAQALLDHAREQGIADDVALEAVMQTLVGGSLLLEQLGRDPGEMVQRLIDYDGTTAQGLRAMLNSGFQESVQCGLTAAYRAASQPRKAE